MEILLHGSRLEDARLFSDFTWRICAVSLHTDDQTVFSSSGSGRVVQHRIWLRMLIFHGQTR
jgi:hypothetical protein